MSDLKTLDHENLSNTVYATLCDVGGGETRRA
jgi:hypothetical protein